MWIEVFSDVGSWESKACHCPWCCAQFLLNDIWPRAHTHTHTGRAMIFSAPNWPSVAAFSACIVLQCWQGVTHTHTLLQTCSFCFSASPSLQRESWPCFQATLIVMAKLSSEYYGLSLSPTWNWDTNYTCVCLSLCVCVSSFNEIIFSELGWKWSSLSPIRESKLKPQTSLYFPLLPFG